MYDLRRKLYSQNFLHSRRLVASLLARSSITRQDLVLEIGPGKGILTEQLLEKSAHVIGVELDTRWYRHLKDRFATCDSLTLYNDDFLSFPLPKIPYKVFSNIPFAIEGKIIRKLIDSVNPPVDCLLVVMKELAERLPGSSRENLFSVTHKPWFTFSIDHEFARSDFSPWPSVDAVLFHFSQKSDPDLPLRHRESFTRFVTLGFGNGLSVWRNLSRQFPPEIIQNTLSGLGIGKKTLPNRLSVEDWIALFNHLVSA